MEKAQFEFEMLPISIIIGSITGEGVEVDPGNVIRILFLVRTGLKVVRVQGTYWGILGIVGPYYFVISPR